MSAAQQTREKRTKQATAWYAPPPGVAEFAAVPHVAPLHDDALSGFQIRLTEYLKHPKRASKNEDEGYTVHRAPTLDKIAADLRASKSTVRRSLNGSKKDDPLKDGLIAKQSIQVFKVFSGNRTSGRRVATHYYIPPFAEVLLARRAIPGIALTAAGHPLVIGRRRRLMMTPEAVEWDVNLDLAPASERQAKQREREHSVTHRSVPKQAPLAEMPATAQLDRDAILDRLLEGYHIPANLDDAALLLKLARDSAPQIPIEAILDEMDDILQRKVALEQKGARPRKPTNPGWFHSRMPSHADRWKRAEAARARERDREARAARDARLNNLAQALAWSDQRQNDPARAASEDPRIIEMFEQDLAAADPGDLAEARGLLANTRSRSA